MDLNELAKKITLAEGKKKSISIAQAKEVIRLIFTELAKHELHEITKVLRRYRKEKKC